MKRHQFTLDELFKDKLFIESSCILAGSHGLGENKSLSVRTTIFGLSHDVDVLYIVRNFMLPIEQQTILITSNLESAVAAYNRI